MKKTVAVLCTAMFALTSCGGGDDAEAKENIKASLLEDGADLAGTKVTDEQAGCVSDGMVDDVGVEKLQEYKLLDDEFKIREDAQPTDMEAGDAEALAAVFTDCVDMEKLFEEQFSSGAMADQLTTASKRRLQRRLCHGVCSGNENGGRRSSDAALTVARAVAVTCIRLVQIEIPDLHAFAREAAADGEDVSVEREREVVPFVGGELDRCPQPNAGRNVEERDRAVAAAGHDQ